MFNFLRNKSRFGGDIFSAENIVTEMDAIIDGVQVRLDIAWKKYYDDYGYKDFKSYDAFIASINHQCDKMLLEQVGPPRNDSVYAVEMRMVKVRLLGWYEGWLEGVNKGIRIQRKKSLDADFERLEELTKGTHLDSKKLGKKKPVKKPRAKK